MGLTTATVAIVARHLSPDMPWAAAIALGAIVAPLDAVAALAVLRQVKPPHRIRIILEGESLLNDASALLIYRLAVGAAVTGHFTLVDVLPSWPWRSAASSRGWALAAPIGWASSRIESAPVGGRLPVRDDVRRVAAGGAALGLLSARAYGGRARADPRAQAGRRRCPRELGCRRSPSGKRRRWC
ncbi:cation:proton antiporter domain-containing protein [Sphingomonas sp. MMS24-JH45]